MKLLISPIVKLFTAGLGVWEKSKEWSGKKRIAVLALCGLLVFVTPVSMYFIGWDKTVLAFQLVSELLASLATIL